MNEACINPDEIQEGDLMAYVDGIADEAIAQHVRRCSACARLVEDLASIQAVLGVELHRHSCPGSEQLIAYHQDELRNGERLWVAQHLRQCPHCARELASVSRQARTGLGDRVRAVFEMLEAVLVTPQIQAQAAGLRGEPGADQATPQVFRAAEFEVLVSQHQARAQPLQQDLAGLIHCGGQVPKAVDEIRVELFRSDGLVAVTQASSRGQFAFSAVEPGEYDLELVWPDRAIRLPGVQVG